MTKKFRIVDSKEIHKTLELSIQFQSMIEETALKYNLNVYELPNSILPTNTLYDLVLNYNEMYKKLLENELIASSTNKTINTQTH